MRDGATRLISCDGSRMTARSSSARTRIRRGSRARDKILVQRSGQLMYELSTIYPAISGAMPEWSWDLAHDSTVDGLPYIGLHRNFPRHLFALGHSRHGAAVAWLAARLLLRLFQDSPEKGDELFGFSRILK